MGECVFVFEENATVLAVCGKFGLSIQVFRLRSVPTAGWRAKGAGCFKCQRHPHVVYGNEQQGVREEEGGKRPKIRMKLQGQKERKGIQNKTADEGAG